MIKFMQTDGRWGGLGYPRAPYYIRNCGCGECAIANIIVESVEYRNATPKTIQPYCKQFADPNGNGTYWSGIPEMMKHYGLTEVMEHGTMKPLWNELEKGSRVAVFLMGSRPGGTKRVHWTSSGHFVCATDYKYENGKHYVFIKDSYSNSSLRNGWITYEENMAGDVLKVWSGKIKMKEPYTGGLPIGLVTKGATGTDVKHIQKFLNWYYGKKVISVDGVCGDITTNLIKKWEKENGIKADGVFGPLCKKKAEEIIKKYSPSSKKSNFYSQSVIIGEARCNEMGTLSGGKPGDQTGREVGTGKWYDGGWLYCFRAKDKATRLKLAKAMLETCNNEHIGYNIDSPNRFAAWDNAEANGHKIAKINKNGDTTCSEAVSMCMRAAGIPKKYAPRFCDIAALTKVMTNNNPYFKKYTAKRFLTSSAYLQPGDILLSSHHTVIVIKSPNVPE